MTSRAKRALGIDRGPNRRRRIRERDAECIADDAERVATVTDDRSAKKRVVKLRRRAHRLRLRVPERRASLDVGKKEREGLRWRDVHLWRSAEGMGTAILRQTRKPRKRSCRRPDGIIRGFGEMAEWSKAPDSKLGPVSKGFNALRHFRPQKFARLQ